MTIAIAEKIRNAPNAAAVNAALDSGEALIRRGRGIWAFTVSGSIRSDGSFSEAREAAARFNEA